MKVVVLRMFTCGGSNPLEQQDRNFLKRSGSGKITYLGKWPFNLCQFGNVSRPNLDFCTSIRRVPTTASIHPSRDARNNFDCSTARWIFLRTHSMHILIANKLLPSSVDTYDRLQIKPSDTSKVCKFERWFHVLLHCSNPSWCLPESFVNVNSKHIVSRYTCMMYIIARLYVCCWWYACDPCHIDVLSHCSFASYKIIPLSNIREAIHLKISLREREGINRRSNIPLFSFSSTCTYRVCPNAD